jgi:hypothetical protein
VVKYAKQLDRAIQGLESDAFTADQRFWVPDCATKQPDAAIRFSGAKVFDGKPKTVPVLLIPF